METRELLTEAAKLLALEAQFKLVEPLGAMSKHSELAGIAHNIAHHARSGLSYVSAH